MMRTTPLSLLVLVPLMSLGCSVSTTRYVSTAAPQQGHVIHVVDRGDAGCCCSSPAKTSTSKPNHGDPGGPRPQSTPKPQPKPQPRPEPRQPPREPSKPPRVPSKPAV